MDNMLSSVTALGPIGQFLFIMGIINPATNQIK